MTKLKIGVISALVVASVMTPLVIQHQAQIKLRDENQSLRQQQAQQAAENERLSNLLAQATNAGSLSDDQLSELLRLRGEVGSLRQQNTDLAQAESRKTQSKPQTASRTAAHDGTNDLAGELRSVGELNNVGIATPRSAFETWNWAKASQDIKTLANTLVLDEDAKAKAESILASLPDSKRVQFGSTEELIAALQAISTPITAMRVVSEQNLSADDMVLLTQWQFDDGQMRTNSWQFHRYDDGWRQVIRGGLVDKLGAMVNNRDFTR